MTGTTLIVIPARWGSTRLPGKPLADLEGKSLVQRTAEVAAAAIGMRQGLEMIVATDDEKIAGHVRDLDYPVVLTDSSIENGTARALAAARAQSTPPDFIINLQGDSPFTPPQILLAMMDKLSQGAKVVTPVVPLDWTRLDDMRRHKLNSPFSGTTCVRNVDGQALWFSKQIIPAIRNEEQERTRSRVSPILRHIGLYGYETSTLQRFCDSVPSALERVEGLEQLRLLELGIPIQTVDVDPHIFMMSGIDSLSDLEEARSLLRRHGEPDWA